MALESGTYINSLNASNPASTDGLGQADDHLRLIKSTIKATFPNITGEVTATQSQLNNISSVPTTLTDLGISDGTSGQFLTTNGSGSFSFATVSQGSSGIALADLSVGSEGAASGNGSISYNNSTGVFTYTPPTASGIGALTGHPTISGAASSSNNSGQTFIQDITLDGNGHVTGLATGTAAGLTSVFSSAGTFSSTRIESLGSSTQDRLYIGTFSANNNRYADWSTSSDASGAFYKAHIGGIHKIGVPSQGSATQVSNNSSSTAQFWLYLPAGVTLATTQGTNQSPMATGIYITIG